MRRLLPVWLAWLLLAQVGVAFADDDGRRRGEIQIAVDPDVRLDVELINGSIEIDGWDEPAVRIRSRGVDVTKLDIDSDSDWVSVRSGGARGGWLSPFNSGADIDLRIDLPKGSFVRAKTINGSIRLKDVEGRISLHAANGKIEVRGAPSEAYLETVSGDIELETEGGRVEARTVNGEITLDGVAGEVVSHAVNGSIRVRGGVVERAELRSLSGSIDLELALAPGGRLNCKTISGDVDLELPANTSAHFEIQSFSGGLESELGPQSRSRSRRGSGQRLDFEVGSGDGRVTIDTFSGHVKIRTRD